MVVIEKVLQLFFLVSPILIYLHVLLGIACYIDTLIKIGKMFYNMKIFHDAYQLQENKLKKQQKTVNFIL